MLKFKKQIVTAVFLIFLIVFTPLIYEKIHDAASPAFSGELETEGPGSPDLIVEPSPGVIATEKASLPSPSPSPTIPPPAVVDMKVTGDLMVHSWQLNFSYDKESDSYDFNYNFSEITQYLDDADITIGNLETTFAGKDQHYSDYPMFNTPDSFADALKNAGFDFVSTANNHCNDRWEIGILRTIETLDAYGIGHTGTFASQEARDAINITEINGISFVFLSYTYGTNGLELTEGKPWLANIISEGLIVSDIKRARALNPDFVVVFPHMGNEYESYTRDVFKGWARLMLEAGADIILASHPHVLQPVEFYSVKQEDGSFRDAFVAYSLGNFISSQRDIPRESGIIMHLSFENPFGQKAELKEISYIPTWVKFVNTSGAYDIKVLSVYDALKLYEAGIDQNIRPSDISRLKDVHAQTTKMYLGESLPLDEIKSEYIIERKNVVIIE
jgi:poly-gamma-glutamate synthesis protein (capsule biosynthesis protein)